MKNLIIIATLLFSLACSAQQNMPSVGYRYYGWNRIATGNNDVGVNHSYVGLQIGSAVSQKGVYLYPLDTAIFTAPPQGMVVSFAGDSNRLYQFNGLKWERLGGGGGIVGGPFESPLTFTSGLTRTSNTVKWGGTITSNTLINGSGSYNILFNNTKLGINQLSPQFDLDVNGTARIATLPNLTPRDTFLTYDATTKQIGYTTRPACLDSVQKISIVVGVDYPHGDSTYTSTSLVGKAIKIFREGYYLYESTSDGYEYYSGAGQVVFHPKLNYRERVTIEYVCDPSYTSVYLVDDTGQNIVTNSGQTIKVTN